MVAGDRGQVLLLGGLAIAIVFLTAIPLSNSLVVSESASSSETVDDIDRTERREASVERGIRTVLAGVNTSNTTAVNESLRAFSTYYTNVSGHQGGVYVNATVNVGQSEKSVDRNSLSKPGGGNWQNPLVTGASISAYNLTITDINVPVNSAYTVRISNSSETWELRVYEQGGGPPATVKVDVRPPGATWTSVGGCDSDTPLDIDVAEGTCSGGGSFTTYSDDLQGPYTVSFPNSGQSTDGRFSFIGSGDFNDDVDTTVRNPAINLSFVGSDVSYERTILANETS